MRIRRATPDDAPACAAILNDWIDGRDWMPRVHSAKDVMAFYADFVLVEREVWVAGNPVRGFLALDAEGAMVTALYVATPGQGIGRALLDHAKSGRDRLDLWTFQANEDAQRFYDREGFVPIGKTEGDNEEGLPDILLRWERQAAPRMATRDDLRDMARIVADWEAGTDWLPDPPSEDVIADYLHAAFDQREIWVIGQPAHAYASFNPNTDQLGAIYCAAPGSGHGKRLMDRVKVGREFVWLTTHVPNAGAHRFYDREGFVRTGTLPGEPPHEKVPLYRMEWQR